MEWFVWEKSLVEEMLGKIQQCKSKKDSQDI